MLLVKSLGANFHLKNEDEESPLDLASELEEKEIVDFFTGAKPFAKESPEYRLFFGEENEMNLVHREHQPQQLVRSVALF